MRIRAPAEQILIIRGSVANRTDDFRVVLQVGKNDYAMFNKRAKAMDVVADFVRVDPKGWPFRSIWTAPMPESTAAP